MEQFDSHDALPFGAELVSEASSERYRIDGFIGQGGFGIAYRAIALGSGRAVVVKEYLPSEFAIRGRDSTTVVVRRTQDRDAFERGLSNFLKEAVIVRGFDEESIVKVLDVFRACGTAYFVMPFEDAETLAERLKRTQTVPEEELRGLFLQLLDGLQAVHDAGYLHRDIKPSNVLLRKCDGRPLLIDFGAARQALLERSRSISMVLTPGYAPPEQYTSSSKRQGRWTDLYAIGATLYRCVTGLTEEQMNERSSLERRDAIKEELPDPLEPAAQVAAGDYSPTLLHTIDWMLRLEISERPQDARIVQSCLLGDAAPPGLLPKFPSKPETSIPPDSARHALRKPESPFRPSPPEHRNPPKWHIVAAAAAAIAAVTIGLAVFSSHDDQTTPMPATQPSNSQVSVNPMPDVATPPTATTPRVQVSLEANPARASVIINGTAYRDGVRLEVPAISVLDLTAVADGYKSATGSVTVTPEMSLIRVQLCPSVTSEPYVIQPPDQERVRFRPVGSATHVFSGVCPSEMSARRRLADRACEETYSGATRDPRRHFETTEATDTRRVSGEVLQQSCQITAQCILRDIEKVRVPAVTRNRQRPNDTCSSSIEIG